RGAACEANRDSGPAQDRLHDPVGDHALGDCSSDGGPASALASARARTAAFDDIGAAEAADGGLDEGALLRVRDHPRGRRRGSARWLGTRGSYARKQANEGEADTKQSPAVPHTKNSRPAPRCPVDQANPSGLEGVLNDGIKMPQVARC